jgi:hypothetical protein
MSGRLLSSRSVSPASPDSRSRLRQRTSTARRIAP